jgi:hypothetical protein
MESLPSPIEVGSGVGSDQEQRWTPSGYEIAEPVKEQVARLTGLEPGRVTGLCRDGDGWRVTVEMVELKRIPHSTDMLGAYEVQVDAGGTLLAYKRTGRYQRGDAMAET